MDLFFLGLAIVVIVILLLSIIKSFRSKNQKTKKSKNLLPVKCPLCNSELFVGENLISKVYRPMNVPDQLMIILGCPHCYPKSEPNLTRTCPVCHEKVAQNQSLTARLFNKSIGKKHVHIIGCSNCHKPNPNFT